MRRIFLLFAVIAGTLCGNAQINVDNFTVGPYSVDYLGPGDVRYRLRDDVDLYDFFELQKDTTIVMAPVEFVEPVGHGIEISAQLGTNMNITKEFKISGLWKQRVASGLYFNAGLMFGMDVAKRGRTVDNLSVLELGVPLQLELSNLNWQKPSFYGLIGVTPTYYSTTEFKKYPVEKDTEKPDGFMITPAVEVGCNVPFGASVFRIGVTAFRLQNCTKGDFDVIKDGIGRSYVGGKIGVVF